MGNQKREETKLERLILKVKIEHPEHIVWLRKDGFVQSLNTDAVTTSLELGCTLSENSNGVKITGFDDNMLSDYLIKMIKAGHTVAILDL